MTIYALLIRLRIVSHNCLGIYVLVNLDNCELGSRNQFLVSGIGCKLVTFSMAAVDKDPIVTQQHTCYGDTLVTQTIYLFLIKIRIA